MHVKFRSQERITRCLREVIRKSLHRTMMVDAEWSMKQIRETYDRPYVLKLRLNRHPHFQV
jgi:hypothetical protein